MEIAIFLPDHEKGLGGSKLALLIHRSVEDANISLFPMNEPMLNPLPLDLDAAFVLADDLEALLTLEKLRIRAPTLPIIVVSHGPDFAMEGIRRQVAGYLIWPLETWDLRKIFMRTLKIEDVLFI